MSDPAYKASAVIFAAITSTLAALGVLAVVSGMAELFGFSATPVQFGFGAVAAVALVVTGAASLLGYRTATQR